MKSLLSIRKQLASLTMVSESTQAETNRQKRNNQLVQQEKAQPQQLAREGGSTLGSSAWIETEALRKALKTNSVLVEITRFARHDFTQRDVDGAELPENYVAWVIPSADGGKIQAVDLGFPIVLRFVSRHR